MTQKSCPFCAPSPDRVFYRDALVVGLWDGFPVTPGHALLIPIRHVETWFDASVDEQMALMRAVNVARLTIQSKFEAHGYNIGINSGEAAGQTIFHVHVHVIPRRRGDVSDPRGGVRYVIPEKANYVRDSARIADYHPPERALFTGGSDPLLPQLKHHLGLSSAADFAVAFTLRSGLQMIQPYLQELLDRGGKARVLTGDYLDATDPDALLRLLDLNGDVECRIFETSQARARLGFGGSFHPKAYLFRHRDGTAAAFVGSSNLSQSALTSGVEWNYRVLESRDRAGWAELRFAFDSLFLSPHTVPLTPEWIANYKARRPNTVYLSAAEVSPDPEAEIPTPHLIQQEALAALQETRAAGRGAGLVVLATGLGKTWLSAFDSERFRRVLFVAHRDEILGQALETYRATRPHESFGRYTGEEKSPAATVLFASIQTLGRQAHLNRFAPDEFDYIVVDEFHHAEAQTYRRLINHFRPRFLLGLTATPERTDGADLLNLCDDNLVYRCDLSEGIRRELLCPFRYFGVPDTVDYRNIPWRNKKFDENELTKAMATQARAKNALEQYRQRGGQRTLAFCVSQRHADFMKVFFTENGVAARAVHSGDTSDPRAESLEALRDGKIAILCAVDMFNEGVDLPTLDTVMMLRPTESRIVWLQQFGRGLRRSNADKKLTVIDYIGNHRSFMLKPQALFGLPPGDREILNLLERLDSSTAELPPGCEVTYELEAKNILRALLKTTGSAVDVLTRRYQDFRDTLGVRPTAAELSREGYNPRVLRTAFGSWLGFVKTQRGLGAEEVRAYDESQGFLDALETTDMTRSYKMLVLLAVLNRNQFPGSLTLSDLASEVAAIAHRDPRVAADIGEVLSESAQLQRMLKANPIEAWVGGRGTSGVRYFSFDENTLSSRITVPNALVRPTQELAREIVDWRLAEYFRRPGQGPMTEVVLKVSHADGRPILFLPDRIAYPELPEGWTELRVDDYTVNAHFVKIAVNVVNRPGSEENILPQILHAWFGPDAGKPGTKHQVTFCQEGQAWRLAPRGTNSAGTVPFKAYKRPEIASLFGLPYSERSWGQGFVRQGNHTFLFVTLDKTEQSENFKYKDRFLSGNEFQWQSQNRTSRQSDAGETIKDHKARGITVHLFVRAKAKVRDGRGAPFYDCGTVDFVSWEADKPITVIWRLDRPVPEALLNEFTTPVT